LLEDVGDDDAMRPIVQAGLSLEAMERQLIEATLQQFGGHRERTAGALGIGVRTLSNKLRNYGYAPRANAPAA
jgi:DNA-binding NtrC family response regulator